MGSPSKEDIKHWFMSLQDDICHGLEKLDGVGSFSEDLWTRPEGGGGRSRVILGKHIAKGGVNFSAVEGRLPEKISNALGLSPTDFFATGVSIVLHPDNPHVPIIHMNVRYFETSNGEKYWFGGGIDVTPHYIMDAQAKVFHNTLKQACDKFDNSYYPEFKKWADDYFYIPHRKETRGIGGIFFDKLADTEQHSKADRWEFVQEVGSSFLKCYTPLFNENVGKEYSAKEKEWQKLRRGRYVEFNLVWDKGTKFGLQTNGRIESILMSMPPQAEWVYDHQVESGSEEEATLQKLRKEIDWINGI